ncbi:cytochrome P450 CYP72A616-like [Humulus lupulus]|uniref:cytochrome P450 CYP72A616-like n=1 Tax=Humulus lupulus TaxID=3486 RepID=UPI002B40FBB3|nr:cytochrome P450 CYP72A616-like [Humulus lupulus]
MCWWERTPRLVIVDSELIRLILADKNGEFVKPPQNPLVNILQLGLPTLVGEQWSKRRRILAPAFHLEKLKRMLPAFSTSCCSLIERWKKLTNFRELTEVDVMQEFHILTVDVISRTAFGSCYEEGKKIFELQKQHFPLLFEAYYNTYIPGFRFVPTKKNRKRYELDNKIKAILHDLIRDRTQAKQTEEMNLLDLLLQNTKLGNDNIDENNCLSINDVIEECKLFYIAGQDTSASLLTWTMVSLSMHPNWQEKAREEVLQLCGMKTPTFEAINHLKIVSMILNEVLRLYPPASIQSRYTKQETRIGGMKIPAGVELTLLIVSLHHDPEHWGNDAEEFNPERFSEGVGKSSKAFYPFGWGPRICLGQNFAMIEAKMGLAMILQNFSFHLSPSYIHSPRNGVTLQPQHGVPIILHPLNNY